jgi:hypothetical protein
MSVAGQRPPVLLTGANGFVAFHILSILIDVGVFSQLLVQEAAKWTAAARICCHWYSAL